MKKLFVILLIQCSLANASNIEELKVLAKETHRLFGHSLDFSMPQVEYINTGFLEKRICDKKCPKGFTVKGFYQSGVIYLSETVLMNDDWDRAYFVHEMVHYYQEKAGFFSDDDKTSCQERQILELQAYTIQNQYLRTKGKFLKDEDIRELVAASSGYCVIPQ